MQTKQPSWEDLRERFKVKSIDNQKAYGLDGTRTGMTEKHIHLRCAEIGIHFDIAGAYRFGYAQDSLRRKNNLRGSYGDQVSRIAAIDPGRSSGPAN